jgi:hypothetical protein
VLVWVCPKNIAANGQVLLQVGYFIMSSPELQLGFVLKVEDNILLLGFIRQAQTVADSDL